MSGFVDVVFLISYQQFPVSFHDNHGTKILLSNNNKTAMKCEIGGRDAVVMLHDPMAENMLYEVIQSLFMMLRDPMAVDMLYEVIQSLLVNKA